MNVRKYFYLELWFPADHGKSIESLYDEEIERKSRRGAFTCGRNTLW